MNLIRTLIIDDEPAAVDAINELVRHLAPDIKVIATASNGLDALRQILEAKPDLIFLDVDMPMMNGLQVMERLPAHDGEVVFTTGSTGYALMALKLGAADYLVKPIDPADLLLAIEKVRKRIAARTAQTKAGSAQRIQLPTQHSIVYLSEAEISHVIGMGSYCQIVTVDKEKITVSKNIGQLEQKLSPERFFRCHNSHIINLDFVNMFNTRDGNHVVLRDGAKVEVSRRNKDLLLQKLAERSK